MRVAGAIALLAALVPAVACAQAGWGERPPPRLDPALPDGADIFRAACLEAGFDAAPEVLTRSGLRPAAFAPITLPLAESLASGASFQRGDPVVKSADDVLAVAGEATLAAEPAGVCSVFSHVTPLAAAAALGFPPGEVERAFAASDDGALRIVPPVLASRFAPAVPGGRGVTALTVGGIGRPDEPGSILSAITVTPAAAVRIAAALARHRLSGSTVPSYEEALGRIGRDPSESTP